MKIKQIINLLNETEAKLEIVRNEEKIICWFCNYCRDISDIIIKIYNRHLDAPDSIRGSKYDDVYRLYDEIGVVLVKLYSNVLKLKLKVGDELDKFTQKTMFEIENMEGFLFPNFVLSATPDKHSILRLETLMFDFKFNVVNVYEDLHDTNLRQKTIYTNEIANYRKELKDAEEIIISIIGDDLYSKKIRKVKDM